MDSPDPNLHWDGVQWHRWNGSEWMAVGVSSPSPDWSFKVYSATVTITEKTIMIEQNRSSRLGGKEDITIQRESLTSVGWSEPTRLKNGIAVLVGSPADIPMKGAKSSSSNSLIFLKRQARDVQRMLEVLRVPVVPLDELIKSKPNTVTQLRADSLPRPQKPSITEAAVATVVEIQESPLIVAEQFMLWGGPGWTNQEVVGESFYAENLKKLYRKHRRAEEISGLVVIRREPHNRHDRNACAVLFEEIHVGYLPRDIAASCASALESIEECNLTPTTAATIRFYQWDEGELNASVRIELGPSSALAPSNSLLTAESLIPRGSSVRVLDEAQHMDAVGRLVASSGAVSCYVTLLKTVEGKKKPFLTAHVDGELVGRLSPQSSAALMPIVDALEAKGLVTAAAALIEGNVLDAEITLHVAKAKDLSAADAAALLG